MFLRPILPLLAALLLALSPAQAQEVSDRPIPEEPFAKQKVALQISHNDPVVKKRVLTVASMLLKEYGMDRLAVEVVAFGPGMKLLLKDSEHTDRIRSLAQQGVRFSACSNTYRFMTQRTGEEPRLVEQAVLVPSGVARLLKLEDAGYTIIKP